ncbi:hypothetical protein RND81_01G157500 [Saponaria officinalis]|uniref:Peptidase A1 domain-containing protein n=1 Tax=Saponaria officinalis TaxID=3572 RepID=A0AAW1NFT0_SAPOF
MIKSTLIVLKIFTFLLSVTSYDTKIPNGLTLKMIHRDSPESPIYRANLTDKERMKKYIKMSSAKVKSLGIMLVKNKSFKSLKPNRAMRPTITEHFESYMVQAGIGTFGNDNPISKIYYLYLDTGNDLIWTQCKAAGDNHFNQVDPLFPESESSSYHPISCDNCPPNSKCEAGVCIVNKKYHDNARVSAIAATEVFTFATEGGHSQSLPNIIFGCGINMLDFPEGKNVHNKISGAIGLGYGFYGLMEQTQMIFRGTFSYCLQPAIREGYRSLATPMYLRFGNDILPGPISGLMTMMATSIFRNRHLTQYYLNVEDMSVGSRKLNLNPHFFTIKDDGTGGFVIDTGIAMTYIIREAYHVVMLAIKDFMKVNNYNVREMKTPELGYELCYRRYKNPKHVNLPTVTFHFSNNADYIIPTTSTFYMSKTSNDHRDMYCMNFFPDDHRSYLGALHQVHKRIVYDTRNSVLYFAEVNCFEVN